MSYGMILCYVLQNGKISRRIYLHVFHAKFRHKFVRSKEKKDVMKRMQKEKGFKSKNAFFRTEWRDFI